MWALLIVPGPGPPVQTRCGSRILPQGSVGWNFRHRGRIQVKSMLYPIINTNFVRPLPSPCPNSDLLSKLTILERERVSEDKIIYPNRKDEIGMIKNFMECHFIVSIMYVSLILRLLMKKTLSSNFIFSGTICSAGTQVISQPPS